MAVRGILPERAIRDTPATWVRKATHLRIYHWLPLLKSFRYTF